MDVAELFMKSTWILPTGKYIFEDWQRLSAPPWRAELFLNKIFPLNCILLFWRKMAVPSLEVKLLSSSYDDAVCQNKSDYPAFLRFKVELVVFRVQYHMTDKIWVHWPWWVFPLLNLQVLPFFHTLQWSSSQCGWYLTCKKVSHFCFHCSWTLLGCVAPSSDELYDILPNPFIVKLNTPVKLTTGAPWGGGGKQWLPFVNTISTLLVKYLLAFWT